MDYTKVIFKDEAKAALLIGAETVAAAVGCTMGPDGKTVLLHQQDKPLVLTKDGVTVAKSINIKHPISSMGAGIVKEAASQTNESVGDGTTTATVITYALMRDGFKYLSSGYNARELINGLKESSKVCIDLLKESAKQVTTRDEVQHVATISSNGDQNIGKMIADAVEKAGKNGIVTVEDAKGMNTSLEVINGTRIERGYLSSYFVTNSDKMVADYENCRVLVTDKKISSLQEMINVLEFVSMRQEPLLIIADEVEGEALQALIVNKTKAALKVVAIKAPGYGQNKQHMLQDIALLCGTVLVSPATGISFKDINEQNLGKCRRATVTSKHTTLLSINNENTLEIVKERLTELEEQLQDPTISNEEVFNLKARAAKLAGRVAVIRVGGSTELEMVEKKHRIEDALNATRAAIEEGIIAGGGTALYRISSIISEILLKENNTDDHIAGVKLLCSGIVEPMKRILQNANFTFEVIANEVKKNNNQHFGFNVATETYEDLIESGVVDPVKVTRVALENSVSAACAFLSLDAVVYNHVDEV